MCKQLKGCSAFRTKISLTDRRLRIALDRNEFAVLMINQLPAADATIRANGGCDFRVVGPRVHRARLFRHRLQACAVLAFANLANDRPIREPGEHAEHLTTFRRSRQLWSQENGTMILSRFVPTGARI